MPTCQTAVFDLDGTLLNTLDDLCISIDHALRANDCPPRSRDEIRSYLGNGMRVLVHLSVPEGSPAELEEAVASAFKEHYAAHCEDHTGPYDGIPELLERLRAEGMRLAVVSNKGDFAVQELIARQFPGTFDAVLGECEERGIRKKPAPDMVEAALERLGVTREGLVYIGDSEVDLETAEAVGCPCVICSWGFRSREQLEALGAQTIVGTPDELGRVLLGANL